MEDHEASGARRRFAASHEASMIRQSEASRIYAIRRAVLAETASDPHHQAARQFESAE
jgi:hypothetical protein